VTVPKLAILDFESYYSREYSLSKMTGEQYVMDPRFETICCAILTPDTSPQIDVSWGITADLEAKIRVRVPDIEERYVLAWNAKFDGAVLEWRMGMRPRGYICVMSMFCAWYGMGCGLSLKAAAAFMGLPPKGDEVTRMDGKRLADMPDWQKPLYEEYCRHDARLCMAIFQMLLAEGFPEHELKLIDATDKCYLRSPVVLNAPLAVTALAEERARRASLLNAVNVTPTQLRSKEQFAELLRAEGCEPPIKVSPSNEDEVTYAFAKTDEEFTDLLEHDNPKVVALVEAKLGTQSSLIETRLVRLLDIDTRGTIPIPISYAGAKVTQRWGADKAEAINMQNNKRGSVLREVLCAPRGSKLVAVDLSGIELRVARWLAANWYSCPTAIRTVQTLAAGGDVYCETASRAYGRTITKADKPERQAGKETDLSCQFRVAAAKLNHRLRTAHGVYLDPGMDKILVKTFRTDNREGVVRAWKELDNILDTMRMGGGTEFFYPFVVEGEYVHRPAGLSLWYPNLRYDAGYKSFMYSKAKGRSTEQCFLHGGSLFNNCITCGAQVLTDRGWVVIEDVQLADRVWDGQEFVTHAGVVSKGVAPCTHVDAVFMTFDHEVLTAQGWCAAEKQPVPIITPYSYDMPAPRFRHHDVYALKHRLGDSYPVYDILDAGPRQRFMVAGASGGIIVHNCVQSLSRDIMAHGWELILDNYPEMYHPFMTVHDELVSCVPEDRAQDCVNIMSWCMTQLPEWAQNMPVIQLPLAVEANIGDNYKECK
jgi:DNA polymerase